MDDLKGTQSETAKRPVGIIDAKQRRALARLGLAGAAAYGAPILLALRSAPRDAESLERFTFAA